MKLKTFILFIISIRFMSAQTAAPYDPAKKYTVAELHTDLAILKDALVKTHPGLFWYQSEKEFETNYIKTKNAINSPMTELAFHNLITPFVGNVKCGHTDLVMSEAFDKHLTTEVKIFPFDVKIIESKIYVTKNYTPDSTILSGAEITAINGLSADSILRCMQAYAWADGFTTSYQRPEGDFGVLLYIYGIFNSPNRYTVNVTDANRHVKRIDVEALTPKTIETVALKRYAPESTGKQEFFKFRVIDSLSTAVIKIDAFDGKRYETFLAHSFKTLKDKGYKNLIIDLRGNDGGMDYYGRLLYAYIALKEYRYYKHLELTLDDPKDSILKYGKMSFGKMQLKYIYTFKLRKTEPGKYDLKNSAHPNLSKKPFKPHKNYFTGTVFVLIDDESFSTTAEFCAITQYNKRAKFIGRETGGGYCGNNSGEAFLLTLPNTKIRVEIPLIKYTLAVEGPCGRGIKPDYALKENIQDYMMNRDSDMLFTLDLINQSNK